MAHWLGALLMGAVFGLIHVVGPDHLGTLMTLSTVMSSRRAFQVGAAWGLGHSAGMVLIGSVLFGLRHLLPQVKVESWEHYGNYVVGASMAVCALYFMLREGSFLEQRADGSIVARPCACHGPAALQRSGRSFARLGRGGLRVCSGHRGKAVAGEFGQVPSELTYDCKAAPPPPPPPVPVAPGTSTEAATAAAPLLRPPPGPSSWSRPTASPGYGCEGGTGNSTGEGCEDADSALASIAWWEAAWAERDIKGAMLGVVQGACCPMGLVGVSFLASPGVAGQNMNLPAGSVALFLSSFVAVSALGTGALAACWAYLTCSGFGSSVSAKGMYRCSCGLTLILGVLWIAANALGLLGWLDYTDHLHERVAAIM